MLDPQTILRVYMVGGLIHSQCPSANWCFVGEEQYAGQFRRLEIQLASNNNILVILSLCSNLDTWVFSITNNIEEILKMGSKRLTPEDMSGCRWLAAK